LKLVLNREIEKASNLDFKKNNANLFKNYVRQLIDVQNLVQEN